MLVLTRKIGEKVFIADNIQITVLKTRGGAARIGVSAPRGVSVVRSELVQRDALAGKKDCDRDQAKLPRLLVGSGEER